MYGFAPTTPKSKSFSNSIENDLPPSLSLSPRRRMTNTSNSSMMNTTTHSNMSSFQSQSFSPSFYSAISSEPLAAPLPRTPEKKDALSDLILISNRYTIASAFSKANLNASLGFLFLFVPLYWSGSLNWMIVRISLFASFISFFLALFNLAEGLYIKYIKPLKWEKVKDVVSKMDAKQRALMGVDNEIAQLVDAVSPSAEPQKPRPIKASTSMPSSKFILKDKRNISFRSLKPTAPVPYCFNKTPDVRNANVNFVLRPPTREPHMIDETFRPLIPSDVRPPFQTYQLSSVPSPEEQIIAGPFQLKYIGPLDTLREFQVHEADLNCWVENLREWFARKIFHPLVTEMKKVEYYLEAKGWSHLSIYNDVPAVDSAPTIPLASTSVFGSLVSNFINTGKTPQSLSGLAAADPNEPLVKSRIQLERFLFMGSYPVTIRSYLIRRIFELASGSHLASYRWDSGGCEDHRPWSSSLPTDAEVVLHVFCTWMDIQMPGANRGLTAYSPFTVKYFRPMDEKSDIPDHLHIQLSVSRPPHFRLCQKRTIYDIFPKRNNLFSAICLFTYNIQMDYSGYVDMLDISGNVVGLTSILSSDL